MRNFAVFSSETLHDRAMLLADEGDRATRPSCKQQVFFRAAARLEAEAAKLEPDLIWRGVLWRSAASCAYCAGDNCQALTLAANGMKEPVPGWLLAELEEVQKLAVENINGVER